MTVANAATDVVVDMAVSPSSAVSASASAAAESPVDGQDAADLAQDALKTKHKIVFYIRIISYWINTIVFISFVENDPSTDSAYFCSDGSRTGHEGGEGVDQGGTVFLTAVLSVFLWNHHRNFVAGNFDQKFFADVVVDYMVKFAYFCWAFTVSPYIPACKEVKFAFFLGGCGVVLVIYLLARMLGQGSRIVGLGAVVVVIMGIVFLALNGVSTFDFVIGISTIVEIAYDFHVKHALDLHPRFF